MKAGEAKLFGCILVIAIVLVAVASWPLIFGSKSQPQIDPPKVVPLTRAILVPQGSHILGDANAPYTLVDFSDLQCSHCKLAEVEIKKQLEKHKGKLNWVYRHFQITQAHLNSQILAQGTEAAGEQGKFFEMIHAIFESQDKLDGMDPLAAKSAMTKMAGALKLDMIKFRAALENDRTLKPFTRDMEFGIDQKIIGTPTFFLINPAGKVTRISTNQDMKKVLDDPKTWQ